MAGLGQEGLPREGTGPPAGAGDRGEGRAGEGQGSIFSCCFPGHPPPPPSVGVFDDCVFAEVQTSY